MLKFFRIYFVYLKSRIKQALAQHVTASFMENTKAKQMKFKVLLLLAFMSLGSFVCNAQRGVRIGYIDTEYILQNVPEYQEASSQLEQKVQKWKSEIDQRLADVDLKKKTLNSERVLLTKELFEERLEDISAEEAEILDYQQKRFGPNGDLVIQKQQLIQPIQDQIFAAVQEIAGGKQYDFIFDKSADVVMLYSADRFDISELVIRSITRSAKRTQATSRAERRAAEEEDVVPEINEAVEEREKAMEEKQTEREAAMADRQELQQKRRDSLREAANARRERILQERADAKRKRDSAAGIIPDAKVDSVQLGTERAQAVKKTDTLTDREKRQLELQARRQKILEERRKAKEEREAKKTENDSVPNNNN